MVSNIIDYIEINYIELKIKCNHARKWLAYDRTTNAASPAASYVHEHYLGHRSLPKKYFSEWRARQTRHHQGYYNYISEYATV